MQPHLRLATLVDVAPLTELIHSSVSGLSDRYYSPDQISIALVHVFGVDTRLILDGTYFIVELDDRIVGCGGWSKRQTLYGGDQTKAPDSIETEPLLDPAGEAARIRAFFVHPDYARRGIGSMVLAACESAASAAGFGRVELIATLPGEPLYSALGYTNLGSFDIPLPSGPPLPGFRMGKSLKQYRIRKLDSDDQSLLWEMLYQSLYVPPGAPAFDGKVLKQPAIANYVCEWGRDGDAGFVAVDQNEMPIGAVWARLMTGEHKGFGYVDDQTPELGLAVVPGWRNHGVGTSLMTRMIDTASHTYNQISLSVSAENPARRLYKRLGFKAVSTAGGSITMTLQLTHKKH